MVTLMDDVSTRSVTFCNSDGCDIYIYMFRNSDGCLPEICFGPVTVQGNIHTLLINPLSKWDQAKQVHNLHSNHLLQLNHFQDNFWQKPGAVHLTHFQLNHFEDKLTMHQVLRLDLKIILPVLLTSTFVIVSVAVVRNTYYETLPEAQRTQKLTPSTN